MTRAMIDWTGHFVAAGDLEVHCVRAGAGAPLVLLHGWPEFVHIWKHNLPVLARRFDVIAPELRGFGQTRGPRVEGGTTPAVLATDLEAFADALGLERFAIVSHDVGAFVAQTFARAHPERVSALVFFDCPYPGIGRRWGAAGHLIETWYQYFNRQPIAAGLVGHDRATCRLFIGHFLRHWAHDPQAFDADLELWVDNFMRPGNLQGGFDWYIGTGPMRRRLIEDGAPALAKIATPTRVLWGEADPIVKVEWADRLGDYFADLTFTAVPETGHFVPYERPELANAAIIEFLERVLPGA